MLQVCVNNIPFYLSIYVYLLLITSAPIMRHDINKKSVLNILKKNRIIKEIANYCCGRKIVSQGSSFSADNKWGYKYHQNFSLM